MLPEGNEGSKDEREPDPTDDRTAPRTARESSPESATDAVDAIHVTGRLVRRGGSSSARRTPSGRGRPRSNIPRNNTGAGAVAGFIQ
jgi:hypothetical protein